MQLTRRNTIIGLGTIAAGAGVIGGSGAFDSVEANRSFEVNVSGDAGALLGLEATNNTITGMESGGAGDNNIIYFELNEEATQGDAAINENAVTEFWDAFRVTNNGSDQTVSVSIILPEGIDGVEFTLAEERNNDEPTDLTTDSVNLTQGESVSVDLRIDTTTDGGYVEPTGGDPYQITIRAVSV